MYLYCQTAFQLLQISISGFSASSDQHFWFFTSQISFSAFLLFCFSAFRLFCFSAFLAFRLFGFSAFRLFGFLAFRLFGFSAFQLFSFSAFPLLSISAFQLLCFSDFPLFAFYPFPPFSFSAFQLLSHQTALARSPSVSQPSQLLKSATYLLSGPLFTLLRKLNGGRKE